jgi:uncharacterized protein
MESRSFGSVRIFWLDKPKILDCLRLAAAGMAELRPEVQEVWLFGSLARGDATPGSDADVLVIIDNSAKPFYERAPDYPFDRCGIGADVLVYTSEELDQLRVRSARFYATFLDERMALYRREG